MARRLVRSRVTGSASRRACAERPGEAAVRFAFPPL